MAPLDASKNAPRLRDLAAVIFRAGSFTFGGGNPTTAVLQRELIARRQWLDDSGFALCYALSRVTPGTNLLAFYTASGWMLRGWPGAILALLVGSLPACALVWAVTAGFDRISANRWVQAGLEGAIAASVGILLASAWLLVRPYMKRKNMPKGAIIVVGSVFLTLYAGWSPILVLLLAVAIGALGRDKAEA